MWYRISENQYECDQETIFPCLFVEAVQYGHDQVVQCLLRHGAGWCEDGIGDLLCIAVGM